MFSKKNGNNHNTFEQSDGHSQFGDAYSVKSSSQQHGSFDGAGAPEVDYDQGATRLYNTIESKNWDAALSRVSSHPNEAGTWVSRREISGTIRWRLLPMHAVCIFRAPLEVLEALIHAHPEGPKSRDDQGMLPIHLACRNGASPGVVKLLLESYPESLDILDRKNRSLSDLVRNSASSNKDAVLSMLDEFRKSKNTQTKEAPVHEVDYENRTILFRLILKKDWKAAASRARDFPAEAATWIVTKGFHGNLRFLPLHKACVLQPPDFVVTALLAAHPKAAESSDQDGWLPLHCACFYGGSEKVIDALLQAHSSAAQYKDDDGRLPLHYACLKGSTSNIVDLLLAAYPKASTTKDTEGRLPIHHACSKGAPEPVIDSLLKASPKSAQSKDDQGRLALHHACRKSASERVIRTLLRVYPRAAQIKDDQDKLPIHYACQHGCTTGVVTCLLTTYPESIDCKNGFGNTPVGEAKAAVQSNPKMSEIVKILQKFKKEQDKIRGVDEDNIDAKIAALSQKVQSLEKTLSKVSMLGKDLRHNLKRGKDMETILDKLAEDLEMLGGSNSSRSRGRSSSPMKSRQLTPSKAMGGLFGRGRSSSNKTQPVSNISKIKA
jgi:ankyrin repeat protein